MNDQNFKVSILVDQSPEEVFEAINNVRGWWQGEIEGDSRQLHDTFTYQFPGAHLSKQEVIELVPGKKVVWLVTDSELSFVKPTDEWTGTKIRFDINRQGSKTEVTLTHEGLVPAFQCYDACSSGWTALVEKSLYNLIRKGVGVDVF